ncbi:Putative Rab-GTPase-TBC domain-containing protein [Septoria linicola]|uniref:Rab-GTPase-TBC domain-containing protein n=1 Tax=Septoria linicola TaxID=215465 RepID=A0A9Q9AXS2_9PEZI|nr:Putative Rab-GTPase-TBC domain-containing protein [Septoria linicola]
MATVEHQAGNSTFPSAAIINSNRNHLTHTHDTPLSAAGFDVESSGVHNDFYSSSHHDWAYNDSPDYATLRALIANEQKVQRQSLQYRSGNHSAQTPPRRLSYGIGAGIALPKSVAVPAGRGFRSVSLPSLDDRMMANVSVESIMEEPSSPPELSYSKSSKSSSSLNSDDEICANGQDGGISKHGHFEEVVLEEEGGSDDREDNNLPPNSRPTLRRPAPKSLAIGPVTRRRSGTSPPLRPLTNGTKQSKYPSLQGAVTGALRDQSLNLPNGRSHMQRVVSSPTLPYMHKQRALSRSPSPNNLSAQNGVVNSPQTLASSTPKASHESQRSITRRTSWQPSRKSTKELEAEYNDEDEDVPDDAILENVPISPLPGHYSVPRSPNLTPHGLRSTTPSPHRRPGPYANMHSANIPKGAKRPSAPPPVNGMPRSPKYPHRPKMPHSNTVGAVPLDPRSRQMRSKSWTEHLNVEARELSQKLEEYAERLSLDKKSTPNSGTNSAASSPPRSSLTKQATSTTTAIAEMPTIPNALPPLQRGDIMIDPLPISKEKEAVLSRTRPSWLPPKDQKEERKHLKEYQQMMARAAESEKKRALKEQVVRDDKVEMQGSIARIWEQHVIPNWDAVVKEPRTRELWWRGVTASSRGEVWTKAIGNELELSSASFEAALARARALEAKIAAMPEEEKANSREAAWLDAIARDVPNTFPEAKMYQEPGSPLHQSLSNVLKAYTMYRSDVGYVYGTHLVAGIVCLQLPPAEAFVLLANMLNRPLPLAFLVHDTAAMQRAYDLTLQTLKYKCTRLHDHLTSPTLDLKAEEFLDPIYRCLFAYNLSVEHVARIWDIFVFEGDKALVRAAVAVLSLLESKLYGSREEILQLIGWMNLERWPIGSEDAFIDGMREAGKVDRRVSA